MAITAETSFENLTFLKSQYGLTQTQLDVIKLAMNGANAIYNLDMPDSAYTAGQIHVTQGYVLDEQVDLRFTNGGIAQPYASEPNYLLEYSGVDAKNGYTATKKLDSSLRGDLPKWYN